MDEQSKTDMIECYSRLLDQQGPSLEALGYKDATQQHKRFSIFTAVEPIPVFSSVLDVGCGLGDLCAYLRKYGWRGAYTGIDVNPRMLTTAQKRMPTDEFICVDLLTAHFSQTFDYVMCAATVQHRPTSGDPTEYLEAMVSKMFSLAKKALVFDVFSSRVAYMDRQNLYVDPVYLLNWCYELTPRVTMRNDYRPYELVVYLYKDASKDDLNIFKGWVPSQPSVIS